MAKRTEEQQLMLRIIERRLMKGIVDYGLIEDGDHLLVGLSGGKDSLALTELLARRARIYRPRFTLTAVHVAMRNIPYSIDADYLRSFCEERGVPFVLREAEFDASTDTRKSPCFLCSWNRRKELFTAAHPRDAPHEPDLPGRLLHHAAAAGDEEVRHDHHPSPLPGTRGRPRGTGRRPRLPQAGEELPLRARFSPFGHARRPPCRRSFSRPRFDSNN